MSFRVLRFQFAKLLPAALLLAVLFAGLAVGAVALFDEDTVALLSEARAQGPALFSALGMGGSATLNGHLASLLYGLLLPLLGGLYAAALSATLLADKIETGEISYWLSLPKGRAAFVLGQALLMAGLLLVPPFGAFLGSVAGALWLQPEAALQLEGLALLNIGLHAWMLLSGALGLWISCASFTRAQAARMASLLYLLLLALGMAGMTHGVPHWLKWFSPWWLYMPQDLAMGRVSLPMLALPGLVLLCVLLAVHRFVVRDLE